MLQDCHNKLIINTNSSETRVALLEAGRVAEITVERSSELSLVGNIYKGVVTRVLPGMNSAFVDIGLEKSAFLFGGDAFDRELGLDFEEAEDGDFLRNSKRPIGSILKEGQTIVVQVSKDPLGAKGPRVTMFLTVAGRYVVYMPCVDHVGISRRIEEDDERERLLTLVEGMRPPGNGVIIRTAAEGASSEELSFDLGYLQSVWTSLNQSMTRLSAPSLVYKDLGLVKKVTRDYLSPDVRGIVIDDAQTYQQLKDFLLVSMPKNNCTLTLHDSKEPIFDAFNIEKVFENSLKKRVELASGAYLIIERTEALTVFDINTGKYVGKGNAQRTILKTNLEACEEIAQQLRLRNIGGIIVIDFIDMEDFADRDLVYESFLQSLKKDRARTNVLKVSELGLLQMTRKRTSDSLERKVLTDCPCCDATGLVHSKPSEVYRLLRAIQRRCFAQGASELTVNLAQDLKDYLLQVEGDLFRKHCEDLSISVKLNTVDHLQWLQNKFEIE